METHLPFLFIGICLMVGKFGGEKKLREIERKARDPLTLCR